MFQALDDDLPQTLPVGEVAYASGHTILTRHLMWRQSRIGLLTAETRSLVLVAEVPGDIEQGIAEAVRAALQSGLQSYFNVPASTFILDASSLSATW